MDVRTQALLDHADGISFPAVVSIGNATVRISQPRRITANSVGFVAAVRIDGKLIDRDDHVIVNPPTLVPDDAGNIERVFEHRDGSKSTKRYRFDPLMAMAEAVLDVALKRAGRQ